MMGNLSEIQMFKNANFFITEFFKSIIGKQAVENISPKIAVAIQKQEYFNQLNDCEETYTPPYVLIGYQLLNEKADIFRSAVYYLCVIAVNTPKYKKNIAEILKNYLHENKALTERVDYVKSMMKEYKIN